MFKFLAGMLVTPVAIGLLGASLVVGAYQLIGPPGTDLGFLRRVLAERLSTDAASDLPVRENVATVGVLDLEGDPDGFVTQLLRETVSDSGTYEVLEEPFFRQLVSEFRNDEAPVTRLDDAVSAARRLGVDAVIFGAVQEFSSSEDGAAVRLELRMADRESGQAVFARSYADTLGGSTVGTAYWRARLADSSKGFRMLVWVLFVLFLPLATVTLIRQLTAEESNAVNLGMLAAYTLADLLVAMALTGFWFPSLWTGLTLLLGFAGSGYYNFRIATAIDDLRR